MKPILVPVAPLLVSRVHMVWLARVVLAATPDMGNSTTSFGVHYRKRRSPPSRGSAAAKAEALKVTKYADISRTHIFIPLAFETLGAWGNQCREFVRDLGRRITGVTGEKLETLYLRQRLSIAIQRGNAMACRGTFRVEAEDE